MLKKFDRKDHFDRMKDFWLFQVGGGGPKMYDKGHHNTDDNDTWHNAVQHNDTQHIA